MANKEDLDLDVEQGGKSKTNMLIIILIVVILAVGGGVAAMFLFSGDDSDGKDAHKTDESAHAAPAHAIYFPLRPTFIINFEDTSKARYVQLDLSVMSNDQHAIDLVQEHSPVIRNNIITILSSQKYEILNTREGKEKLRVQLLNSINRTIAAEVSHSPQPEHKTDDSEDAAVPHTTGQNYIKAVYFTSLVMQ